MDPHVEKGQGQSLQEQDVDKDSIYIDEDLDKYLTDEENDKDNNLRHMRIIITRKMSTQLAGFLKTISFYTESHLQTDQSCRTRDRINIPTCSNQARPDATRRLTRHVSSSLYGNVYLET